MPDFTSHQYALERLADSQDADYDNRELARDDKLFVIKDDGMWEPKWWDQFDGQPRYSFDLTTPIIQQVAGEIKMADFDIKISPAGGDANKDDAKTLDGIVRNIENISNASRVFSKAARSMVTCGVDGWRVATEYADEDSFDQDLVIKPIPNYIDSVWFGPHFEQDASDAKYCFVLTAMPKMEYEEKWPEGSGQSVGEGRDGNAYYYKVENVVVAELLYIKQEDRELVQMSNGKTYAVDDKYSAVKDEMEALGITEVRRRKRKDNVVYSRKLDGGGWLEPEVKTVFDYIPVIPTYGNFEVFEDKVIYFGKVRKQKDPQRVYNYAKSREIAEGALAPRAKYWMTPKQIEGHEDTLSTLNTNNDPVQFFNPDQENPGPPQQNGGAQINQGILATSQSMQDVMVRIGGQTAPGMGEEVNSQSGVAIKALQDKGDIGSVDYFESQEVAICHTAKILIKAIPKVYDTERQVRILGEDGTASMVMLNESVYDQDSQQMITMNDLSKGRYDAVCSSGPSFQNRQQETQAGIMEMAAIDPTILHDGGDILFKNTTTPGMDQLAERKRRKLFMAGEIPESQMTEEEQAEYRQIQQQGQQPDANMIAAQAMQQEAEAKMAEAQIKQEKNMLDMQRMQMDAEFKMREQELKIQQQEIDFAEKQAKYGLQQEQFDFTSFMAMQKQQAEQQQQQMAMLSQVVADRNTMADTLKKLREAMGVDAMVGPQMAMAVEGEASDLLDAQE